jgi:RNA polymerase sigma factor (sigma-70 family)
MDFSSKEAVERLIEKCIGGDRKAQQFFYESFYRTMLGVCLRYASNSSEAQDFLHDGFVKAFNKLKDFKNVGSLEGWLRRIMVNNAIDEIRRKKEKIAEESDTILLNMPSEDLDQKEKELLDKAKAEEIVGLIQQLSPGYRTVFNMYVIEEYSHKEIAEELGISIGTSKSNLAKAKMKIRELLAKKINQ